MIENSRLYIATRALQGLLAAGVDERGNPVRAPEEAASLAVRFTDALLAELAKVSPPRLAVQPAPPADASGAGAEGGWSECKCGAIELQPGIEARDSATEFHSRTRCGLEFSPLRNLHRTAAEEGARRAREIAENVERGRG